MRIARIVGIILLFGSGSAGAATCRPDLQASTPAARFEAAGETVTDNETTLVWMRCAVGQQWNGSTCTGEPQVMAWGDATAVVARLNRERYAGRNDWRLPMLPELASIVERQCFNPRMNETVFPGAPSRMFWSGMEKRGAPGYAYALDFGAGTAVPSPKGHMGAVRLVRGGPWWQPPKMMAGK